MLIGVHMELEDARLFVEQLYTHVLKRSPGDRERAMWTDQAVQSSRPQDLFRAFIASNEYVRKQHVTSTFAPGHYHSPVVDPSTVRAYHARSQAQTLDDLRGISVDLDRMLTFWDDNLAFIRTTPFRVEKQPSLRFFYDGSPYPWGDAIILRAIIGFYRPERIIEIGSGFSTACMLDAADDCRHEFMHITCIEPYPDRLHSLLRPGDYDRVLVLSSGVQDVPLDRFDALGPGDILFIDSTHVIKTGSDVHYELFSILPRLRKGVLVHVHDCPFPFEYPDKWVFDLNYSWNEAYALRAFLMYNPRFSILFWNSFLAKMCRDKLAADYPEFLRNAGSSIWLMVN